MSFVYLLVSTDNSTYVGATVNLDRRLRQHNKEIKGGAHATGAKVANGQTWNRVVYISGFPDWQSTLQFEWRWKQLSRKISFQILPLERRLMALQKLLSLEKSTTKAIPFSEWETPPAINFESEDAQKIYDNITINFSK
jgi:structure-specific endonuclease subunit SLX1